MAVLPFGVIRYINRFKNGTDRRRVIHVARVIISIRQEYYYCDVRNDARSMRTIFYNLQRLHFYFSFWKKKIISIYRCGHDGSSMYRLSDLASHLLYCHRCSSREHVVDYVGRLSVRDYVKTSRCDVRRYCDGGLT